MGIPRQVWGMGRILCFPAVLAFVLVTGCGAGPQSGERVETQEERQARLRLEEIKEFAPEYFLYIEPALKTVILTEDPDDIFVPLLIGIRFNNTHSPFLKRLSLQTRTQSWELFRSISNYEGTYNPKANYAAVLRDANRALKWYLVNRRNMVLNRNTRNYFKR